MKSYCTVCSEPSDKWVCDRCIAEGHKKQDHGEFNGTLLKAEPRGSCDCNGCFFCENSRHYCILMDDDDASNLPCTPRERDDGQDVIWVRDLVAMERCCQNRAVKVTQDMAFEYHLSEPYLKLTTTKLSVKMPVSLIAKKIGGEFGQALLDLAELSRP